MKTQPPVCKARRIGSAFYPGEDKIELHTSLD
jgi:hypothetical protein